MVEVVVVISGVTSDNVMSIMIIIMIDIRVSSVENMMSTGCFLGYVIEKIKTIILFVFNKDILVDLVFEIKSAKVRMIFIIEYIVSS